MTVVELRHGGVSSEVARARLQRWVEEYPRLFGQMCDSDGRPPRHTFFYPVEQYDPEELLEKLDFAVITARNALDRAALPGDSQN